MLGKRRAHILALIFALQLAAGCAKAPDGGNLAPQTPAPANADRAVEPGMEGARDNVEELVTLVRMPYEPEDLSWKEYPAPTGRRLLAVFQLNDEDTRRLVDNASKIRPGTPVSVSSEKWFPKELVTQNEIGGDI